MNRAGNNVARFDLAGAFRESELQADVLSHMRDAVIGLDNDNRVIYWNRAAEDLYEITSGDALGHDCRDFFKIEWLQPVDAYEASRMLAELGTWEGENLHLLSNGKIIFVESSVSVLRNSSGKSIGILRVIRDIRGRKMAARESDRLLGELTKQGQKAEEAFYTVERERDIRKIVMENTGMLIAFFDREFNFALVNPAYASHVGRKGQSLLGKNHFDVFPGGDLLELFKEVRDGGKAVIHRDKPFPYPGHYLPGTTFWDWVISPVKDHSGQTDGLVLTLMETTALKHARDALARSEEDFRMLVESAPDGIVRLTEGARIADCNDWMCRVTSYPREKIVGEKFTCFMDPHDAANLGKKLKLLHSRHDIEMEFNIRRADSSHVQTWAKLISLPARDGGMSAVMYMRDITERKQVDQLKDEFIGMVSHEMRTPLTVIIGGLITLAQDGDRIPDDERRQLMADAISESEELSHILDNLLELSRSQAERLKISRSTVSLADIINKVISKFEKRSAHRFVLDIPGNLPLIEADPLRIERVMHNLLQNATKYSAAGTEIYVEARKDDAGVMVGVHDEGVGIPAIDLQKLFNPFQRMNQTGNCATQGVGLGLVVCRRLIEAHGGRIWLESTEDKGTTCYFTLPIIRS